MMIVGLWMLSVSICFVNHSLGLALNPSPSLEKEVRGCRLEKQVKMEDLVSDINTLKQMTQYPNSVYEDRSLGTFGYKSTRDFIWRYLHDFKQYYDIYEETYDAAKFRSIQNFLVVNHEQYELVPYMYSRRVRQAVNQIHVLPGQGCFPEEYYNYILENQRDPVNENKFLLNTTIIVQDGGCHIDQKAILACGNYASVLIVNSTVSEMRDSLYNARGSISYDRNDERMDWCSIQLLPSLKIKPEVLNRLLQNYLPNDPNSVLVSETEFSLPKTSNIFAVTKSGNHSNIVLAGANYDSFPNSSGINDNGSGIISLLNIAKYLTKFEVKNSVGFAFWGTKGSNPYGSSYWGTVDFQHATKLYLNYDSIGSPNYMYHVYFPNKTIEDEDEEVQVVHNNTQFDKEKHIHATHVEFFEKNNITWKPFSDMKISDAFFKLHNDIPIGGLYSGTREKKTIEEVERVGGQLMSYDECNHLSCDTFVNFDALFMNTRAAAYTIGNYARNLTGFEKD